MHPHDSPPSAVRGGRPARSLTTE